MAVYKEQKKFQRKVNRNIRNINKCLKNSINNRFYITQSERHLYKESILYTFKINDSTNKDNFSVYYMVISPFNTGSWKAFNGIITDFIEETYKKDSKGWNI